MKFEEIAPHLNKLATLYLNGNKKKVGWLFLTDNNHSTKKKIREVSFVNVQKGKRLVINTDLANGDKSKLEKVSETISLEEIVRIRSSK